MSSKTDSQLITRLVNDYSDTVIRIAYQHTGNLHDAEDIAQEVFLSMLGKDFSGFDSEHLKAYVIRAAVNRCHSFHRSKSRRDVVYLDELYRNENEPIFTVQERGVLTEVQRLSPRYRDVIFLFYYEGYSVAEIAGILGTKTGTVSSRLKRAREKLKILLEEEAYESPLPNSP